MLLSNCTILPSGYAILSSSCAHLLSIRLFLSKLNRKRSALRAWHCRLIRGFPTRLEGCGLMKLASVYTPLSCTMASALASLMASCVTVEQQEDWR